MFVVVITWATIIGAIIYSHVAYFPGYLSHLPESNKVITDYGVKDANFWMLAHPVNIVATILALILNWRLQTRRIYILVAAAIYVAAIVATFSYFVPQLLDFENGVRAGVSATDLRLRGQTWQYLSWIRGSFMSIGFILLLIALSNNNSKSD